MEIPKNFRTLGEKAHPGLTANNPVKELMLSYDAEGCIGLWLLHVF